MLIVNKNFLHPQPFLPLRGNPRALGEERDVALRRVWLALAAWARPDLGLNSVSSLDFGARLSKLSFEALDARYEFAGAGLRLEPFSQFGGVHDAIMIAVNVPWSDAFEPCKRSQVQVLVRPPNNRQKMNISVARMVSIP
jgi:hypothetical protein